MKNKITYDRDTLLQVLKCYQIQIKRSGREYPTVVIDDIEKSINAVLKKAAAEDAAAGRFNNV